MAAPSISPGLPSSSRCSTWRCGTSQRSRGARRAGQGLRPGDQVDRGIESLKTSRHASVARDRRRGARHQRAGRARASWIIDPIDGALSSRLAGVGHAGGTARRRRPAAGWAEIPYLSELRRRRRRRLVHPPGQRRPLRRGRTRRSPRDPALRIPPCSTPRNASRSSGSPARCACSATAALLLVLPARARPRWISSSSRACRPTTSSADSDHRGGRRHRDRPRGTRRSPAGSWSRQRTSGCRRGGGDPEEAVHHDHTRRQTMDDYPYRNRFA